MRARSLPPLLFAVLVLFLALPARATMTPINPNPSEPDLLGPNINNGEDGILDYLYGLQNLERIEDYDALSTDQMWTSLDGGVTATAKFADYDEHLGWMDESNVFNPLISYTGASGYINITSFPFLIHDERPFRFALRANGETFTSRMSDNGDMDDNHVADDHMVTFRVLNAPVPTFVMAWEDEPFGTSVTTSDRDYNDLVVEVTKVGLPVPEPSALLLLGGGLLAMGGLVLRRRS